SERSQLHGAMCFPYVLSKIAPLERWSFKRFPKSEAEGTAFPEFCYKSFRPSPLDEVKTWAAIRTYRGAVEWQFSVGYGDSSCISAFPAPPGGYAQLDPEAQRLRLEEQIRNGRRVDPDFVNRAVEGIPVLCSYLEKELGLVDAPAQQFDPSLLSFDGLQH